MNKKVRVVFIAIFFFFLGTIHVNADCSDIGKLVTDYDFYVKQLEGVDCNDTSNEETVIICNNSKLNINTTLIQLMKLKEQDKICSQYKSEVDTIINQNKDKCYKVFDDDFTNFINKAMMIFYILGPILLILFGSLDYAKAVAASDPMELKKANERFFKRVLATVLLFLSPIIVDLILSFNVSEYALTGNAYSCDFDYKVYTKKWTIRVVKKQRTNKINSRTSGNKVLFNQSDPRWGSERLGNGGDTIADAGCALTSIAMQILNSGVKTTTDINPSSLNKILKNSGGFSGSMLTVTGWEAKKATNGKFTRVDAGDYLTGDINNKAQQLAKYLNDGYYPVIQVKNYPNGGSHYVAVFAVENGNIIVGDPAGGREVILNNTDYYIATSRSTSWVALYKIVG